LLQDIEAAKISGQSAHDCGEALSPMHYPPLPFRICPWYSFISEAESNPAGKINLLKLTGYVIHQEV